MALTPLLNPSAYLYYSSLLPQGRFLMALTPLTNFSLQLTGILVSNTLHRLWVHNDNNNSMT